MKKKTKTGTRLLLGLSSTVIACGLLSIIGMNTHHKQHPLIASLEESKKSREASFAQSYKEKKMPDAIATLTGSIDRIEEDIAALSAAIKENPQKDLSEVQQALQQRDEEVHQLLKDAAPVLDKYAEKAMRTKDFDLLKLIDVLQSRSFLFERRR